MYSAMAFTSVKTVAHGDAPPVASRSYQGAGSREARSIGLAHRVAFRGTIHGPILSLRNGAKGDDMAEKKTSSEVKASLDRPHAGQEGHVDVTKPFGDNWGANRIEVYP